MFRFAFAALLACAASRATAATFEVPGNGGKASGIGTMSGWKCPPNDDISIVVDGAPPIPVPSGVRRKDTSGICGNDGRNGYITQINFNLLGAGPHQASIRQNGVQFASGTFTVATLGEEFLTGKSGTYVLENFPDPGRTATVQWSEGSQNFVITDSSSPGCPSTGPITNLTVDCSDSIFFYAKGQAVAGMTSDGDVVSICAATVGDPDVICLGGEVASATAFGLEVGNLNNGPFVPLGPGSGGSIANGGQTLNFTSMLDGETFSATGLAYSSRQVLAATAGARMSDSVSGLRHALHGAATSGASVAGERDRAATSEALSTVIDALGR